MTFLDAIFHVLNISHEQIVSQIEQESRVTLDKLLEKVGIYSQNLLSPNNPDRDFQNAVLDKIII